MSFTAIGGKNMTVKSTSLDHPDLITVRSLVYALDTNTPMNGAISCPSVPYLNYVRALATSPIAHAVGSH